MKTINKTINTIGSDIDMKELATEIITMNEDEFICVEIEDFNSGRVSTLLDMTDIQKLDLGCEYNAAEIFVKFHDHLGIEMDAEQLYARFYCLRDYQEDAIMKVYEDDDIVVALLSSIEFLCNQSELRVDLAEVKNRYYVFNKKGE